MSRPQDAIAKLSRGESVEVAQKDGESARGEALPEGWAIGTLEEVSEIVRGVTFPSKDKKVVPTEGHVICLRTTNIQETVEWHDVLYIPRTYVKNETRWLRHLDILISMANSYELVGKVALTRRKPTEVTFGGFISAIRAHEIEAKYLYYLLREPDIKETIRRTASKTVNIANISMRGINPTKLPIAPKAEQSRIVSAIESLQERSSRARVLLSEVGPLIGQLRQSVLRDAFSGKLTADWREANPDVEPASELLSRIRTERRERWQSEQLAKYEAKGKQPPKNWQDKYKEPEPVDESELPDLPEGWCWAPLELIATHQTGFAFKSKHFADEGIQVVKLGNLYQGRFDLTRDPAYLPEDHEDADAAQIHEGDILVSQTGTRHKRDYGFFVLIPQGTKPLLLNQRVLAVRSIDPSLTEWIVFASRTDFYRDHFFSTETGGVNQGNVGVGGIMRGPIPLAPMAEMKAITSRLEECSRVTSFTAAEIASMESSLTQLDQSILSKAFRGELVPQDPRDEPASELLARIRATRAANAAKKTSKKKKATTTKAASNAK